MEAVIVVIVPRARDEFLERLAAVLRECEVLDVANRLPFPLRGRGMSQEQCGAVESEHTESDRSMCHGYSL